MSRELLGLLDVFVAAVDTGSFAAAAQRTHLTRSAVGKAIARLEQRLGARLLQRNTRQSTLTEAGQLYYEHALRAMAELQSAQELLDRNQREPIGRVRVSMPVVIGRRCVAPLLLALAEQHPQLELDLSFTDRVVDVLHDGVDLALRVAPLAESSDLIARPIGAQRMLLCAAPGYLDRAGRPRGLDDLAQHQCIVYARNGDTKPWHFVDAQDRRIDVTVSSRYRLDDLEAMRDAALAGVGLARLPSWLVADDLSAGRLAIAWQEPQPLSYPTHLVWPRTRSLPLKTRVVVDALLAGVPPALAAGSD